MHSAITQYSIFLESVSSIIPSLTHSGSRAQEMDKSGMSSLVNRCRQEESKTEIPKVGFSWLFSLPNAAVKMPSRNDIEKAAMVHVSREYAHHDQSLHVRIIESRYTVEHDEKKKMTVGYQDDSLEDTVNSRIQVTTTCWSQNCAQTGTLKNEHEKQ